MSDQGSPSSGLGLSRPGRASDLVRGTILAALYVALARIGLGFHAVNEFATLVWPPSGIALAALLALGFRFWPSIAVGAFIANLWNGAPIPVALGIAAGNTGEALFAAWALRRIPGFRISLDRLKDVLGLVLLGGVVSPMISATVGIASLSLGGILVSAARAEAWRAWWLGDSIAILVVTPLLLTWRTPASGRRRLPLAESVTLTLLLGLASYFIFDLASPGLTSLLAPFLIWAALRFDVRGAARATFLVSVIAVWATARGHGPFVGAVVEESLVRLQAFMALTAATFLVLGAMTLERRRSEQARRRAEENTRESEARYRTLADAVEQLMWISDAEGRVAYLNHQWETMVGPLEEGREMGWVDRIHPEDRGATLEKRSAAIASGQPYRLEHRIQTRSGEYRWFLARVVPVRDTQGVIRSWFGAAADVHRLKTTQEELVRAKEAAEEAGRAKDRFLATLSHELRTPLTPVLAFISLLERDPSLSREARRRVEIIRRNAELETRLIDDLLDLTRVATGKLEIHPETVSVREAIDHALEVCREEADEAGVKLERFAPKGELFVRADPARLRQILWNIVKNAVKFTPRGGRVAVRAVSAQGGRVAVEISDTGVGIADSEMARIFQPFEQAAHGKGGLGLGLTISRALVEAHDGILTAKSGGPGEGTTFRIELPAVERPQAAIAHVAAHPAAGVGGRRVLLVEDHGDSAGATRELLTEISCEVVTAGSVLDALAAAQAQPFDLVLSDLGLPDGHGSDLMRELKSRHGLAGIAITGYGMEEDIRRGREAGFVAHLVKPITFQRLAEAVERFFAERDNASAKDEGSGL